MVKRFRPVGCALACALVTAAPAAAATSDPVVSLRVEAGGEALAAGTSYVAGPDRLRTDRSCGGSGRTVALRQPTALGVLDRAADADRDLRPVGVSDQFDFGLMLCRVASFTGSATGFWLYKVNHRSPEVGGDQYVVRNGDEVLWFFQDTAAGVNTGDELVVRAPARVAPGRSFQVRVIAYDFEGRRSSAGGAQLEWAGETVTADERGRATLRATRRGRETLRATRGGDIPSAPTVVCVGSARSCAARTRHRIVGSDGRDVIRGTGKADHIVARDGNDTIDVRGGGADVVDCGRGRDVVRADRRDRVGRSCERVIRRG